METVNKIYTDITVCSRSTWEVTRKRVKRGTLIDLVGLIKPEGKITDIWYDICPEDNFIGIYIQTETQEIRAQQFGANAEARKEIVKHLNQLIREM